MSRSLILSVFALCALTHCAFAGPRDDVVAGVARCTGIADDRAWLNCFYGSAQPMRARLGLPPAPQAQVQLVPPARNVAAAPPPRGGGFLAGALDSTRYQHITAYSFDKHGMFTVTLSDGSIWQQRSDDVNYAHWRGPAASYRVLLKGDASNGTLTVENDGLDYWVQQVR